MKRCILVLLRIYRNFISPLLGVSCRFSPTCSEYMEEAIGRWGIFRGLFMGVSRLVKCHPLHPGGYDPVPTS